jgi:cytochrome c-type biogenesis protein CcmH
VWIVRPRGGRSSVLAGGLAVGLAAAGGGLFHLAGGGVIPGAPLSARVDELGRRDPATLSAPERLALLRRIVAERPEDPQAARFYARELSRAGRDFEAVRQLERASRLAPGPDVLAELGAALVQADGGDVGDGARAIFESALAQDPDQLQARWFVGLDELQTGDPERAAELWAAIVDSLEEGDPRKQGLAAEAVDLLAAAPPVSAPAEAPASPEAMMGRLEARLAETPRDLPGWLRLARANSMLGRSEEASRALAAAAATFDDDPSALYLIGVARRMWTPSGRADEQGADTQ